MSTINLPKGSTKSFTFTVSNDAGLVDLTGARVYLTVKVLGEGTALVSKANTAGGGSSAQIEVLDQVANRGAFKVKFIPADSASLTAATIYFYDAWIVTAAGEYVQVVAESHFKIARAVTTSFPT